MVQICFSFNHALLTLCTVNKLSETGNQVELRTIHALLIVYIRNCKVMVMVCWYVCFIGHAQYFTFYFDFFFLIEAIFWNSDALGKNLRFLPLFKTSVIIIKQEWICIPMWHKRPGSEQFVPISSGVCFLSIQSPFLNISRIFDDACGCPNKDLNIPVSLAVSRSLAIILASGIRGGGQLSGSAYNRVGMSSFILFPLPDG